MYNSEVLNDCIVFIHGCTFCATKWSLCVCVCVDYLVVWNGLWRSQWH